MNRVLFEYYIAGEIILGFILSENKTKAHEELQNKYGKDVSIFLRHIMIEGQSEDGILVKSEYELY